jgi:hypothetical protein
VRILKLSAAVFWLAGEASIDPDAFLSLDGPDIGAAHVATRRVLEDAPDSPLVLVAPMPSALIGTVRNARGDDVAGVSLDLLQPLRAGPDERLGADTPVIVRASTTSDVDGSFTFEHVSEAPILITVVPSAQGRGSTWVTSLGAPVVVELAPPLRARGRVLRSLVPVSGARVRFVPTIEAWSASVDPAENLAEEAVSGDDGTFDVALPDRATGEIQVVAADGATARVPILGSNSRTRAIEIGDVAIPEPRRVVVRLIEAVEVPACDLVAIGPLGSLGLQTVRASGVVNVYTLDLPESGQWTFSADCGGGKRPVTPMLAIVPPAGSDPNVPTIDLRFAR